MLSARNRARAAPARPDRHPSVKEYWPALAEERRAPVNKWAIAVAVALAFLYVVRLAVLPFLVAAAIAYIADPAVCYIAERFRMSRGSAALIVYLGVMALLTGLLELIPVVGPMVSASIIGLLSLEQHGLWAIAAFAMFVTLFRLAIDRVIGPWVLGRAVQIHPVVVMFAFLAGGLFLGVPGVILAVPVAASVKIVLEHYYSHPMRGRRRG